MKKVLFCIAALCAAATGGFAQSFSAATYNVRQLNAGDDARGDGWERRLPVIASLIRYHDFDIFGAQEVFHSQLLDLLAALPGYGYTGVGRDDGAAAGEYAAVFFTLHTDHKGRRAQVESCRLVVDRIRTMCRGERAVLTGDFNVGQTSESYAVLRDSKLLFDACDLAELRYAETGTENGFDPDRKTFRCIDYLFVTEGFRVLRYGILTDTYRTKEPAGSAKPYRARTPSDHFPVQVELTFAE